MLLWNHSHSCWSRKRVAPVATFLPEAWRYASHFSGNKQCTVSVFVLSGEPRRCFCCHVAIFKTQTSLSIHPCRRSQPVLHDTASGHTQMQHAHACTPNSSRQLHWILTYFQKKHDLLLMGKYTIMYQGKLLRPEWTHPSALVKTLAMRECMGA